MSNGEWIGLLLALPGAMGLLLIRYWPRKSPPPVDVTSSRNGQAFRGSAD